MTEHVLILRISCSKYRDLYCILTHLIHHIINQVKSFLICQTGNDSDQHYMIVFIQSKFFLKSSLIHRFVFPEILNVKCLCDSVICIRIPVIIIQTIHNTTKIIRSCCHQSVKSLSIERCLDLFCITVAYCCHLVCIDNTAFEHISIFVCLKLIRNEIIIRESCDSLYSLCIPYTLELQVMYCHNSLDSSIIFSEETEIIQIYRNQTCLPVMTVNQIRAEPDHRKNT